jgi:hypothetical protein
MRFTRTLLAVLVAAAVLPPTAVARFDQSVPAGARPAGQADLRSPDARDATRSRGESSLPIMPRPTWPADPQPIHTAAPPSHSGAGGSGDDTALALGVLGGVLAAGALAALGLRHRRRPHVTA